MISILNLENDFEKYKRVTSFLKNSSSTYPLYAHLKDPSFINYNIVNNGKGFVIII